MSANDLIGLFIGVGYLWAAGHLWAVRRAFAAVQAFGIILYPVLIAWALFYLSLPFIDQVEYLGWYVWLSRIAHIFTIFLVALVVRYGQAILDAIGDSGGSDTQRT